MTPAALALVFAAAVGLFGAGAAEIAWRRRARRELTEEIGYGVISDIDFRAVSTFVRFRGSWRASFSERRAICRLARGLARAKAIQRRSVGEGRRLAQVEVLTLRTRLRRVGLAPGSDRRDSEGSS
jgi:hypothetical protein